MMVVPAGTFRLTGRVLVGGTPLAGATVSIAFGTGTGATTITDSDGQYRLYGVAGVVQVQIVDLKYISLQQSVTVSNNTVADFTLTPSPTLPSPPPSSPTPPNQPTGGYELTGVVIGDDGRVLSGANIHVNFQPGGGGHFIGVSTVADAAGRYDVSFNAVQGRYLEGATALVFVDADGYENEFRWFRPTSAAGLQTLDVHPRAIRQISAGESTSVTVTPDDTLCVNNAQDFPGLGPDYFCRTVRIVASSSGVVTIEAVPQDGQPRPQLETEFTTASGEDVGNPRVMSVTAGQIVKASIELLAGLPAQTFELKTSIAAPRGTAGIQKKGPRDVFARPSRIIPAVTYSPTQLPMQSRSLVARGPTPALGRGRRRLSRLAEKCDLCLDVCGQQVLPGYKKRAASLDAALENNPGSDLLSHTVTHAVPSAVAGLTSVFGMGTGVTLLL